MRSQPNRDYVSDDVVQTPLGLARQIVAHFQPWGRILEPCKGKGNFLRALREHAEQAVSSKPGAGMKTQGSKLKAHSSTLTAPCSVTWAEIKAGRDFFEWTERVDWIVTNPPWSQIRRFLQHAMRVADHVVFLMTINHVWTKARLRDIREAGFGLKEIVLVDMPRTFPQSGFQLGAIYIAQGQTGDVRVSEFRDSNRPERSRYLA